MSKSVERSHHTSDLAGRVRWVVESRRVESYRDWGIRAGISPNYPHQIMSGRKTRPSADVLEAMAIAAGVRVGWLRFGAGSPEPDSEPGVQGLIRELDAVLARYRK